MSSLQEEYNESCDLKRQLQLLNLPKFSKSGDGYRVLGLGFNQLLQKHRVALAKFD